MPQGKYVPDWVSARFEAIEARLFKLEKMHDAQQAGPVPPAPPARCQPACYDGCPHDSVLTRDEGVKTSMTSEELRAKIEKRVGYPPGNLATGATVDAIIDELATALARIEALEANAHKESASDPPARRERGERGEQSVRLCLGCRHPLAWHRVDAGRCTASECSCRMVFTGAPAQQSAVESL
jgi:hypothetical protein